MTQLDDLNDDCLMQVLGFLAPDQLFKMQCLNQRMKRLAAAKMGVKIKAIRFLKKDLQNISNCVHLSNGSLSQDQVLVLESVFEEQGRDYLTPPKRFLSLLDNCSGVKSIGFVTTSDKLPEGLLLEVIKRCPELDCLKLGYSTVEADEWQQVLDRIGLQLVHFAKKCQSNVDSIGLLNILASKCPNIKRVDWSIDVDAHRCLFTALKNLPASCRVALECDEIIDDSFEDVVDELYVRILYWSALGYCLDRLSSLKFNRVGDRRRGGVCLSLALFRASIPEPDFAGLRKLDVKFKHQIYLAYYRDHLVGSLVRYRFPSLEEFRFDVCAYYTEKDYEMMFKTMASIKKLAVYCKNFGYKSNTPDLPREAFHQLKNLEQIDVDIARVPRKFKIKNFIKQIERYTIGTIATMKKLTVAYSFDKHEPKKRVEIVY